MPVEYTTGTAYEEVSSAEETYEVQSGVFTAWAVIRCAWNDRHTIAADILDNRRVWPKKATGVIPRVSRIGITPVQLQLGSNTTQMINPTEALIRIEYSSEFIELFSEEISPQVQMMTLDYRYFRWGSGSGDLVREEEAPGFRVLTIKLVRTEYKVSSVPADLITLIGKVNNATYVSSVLGLSFDIETILVETPQIARKYKSDGTNEYVITKNFMYQPQGWNKYFRPKTGTWENMYLVGSGTPYKSYPPAAIGSILS